MIKSFRHKGIELLFTTGSTKGIQAKHANKLLRQLSLLDNATSAQEMNIYPWRFHALKGKNASGQSVEGHYSIWVNGNWRLTFTFEGEDAILVDYQDYH